MSRTITSLLLVAVILGGGLLLTACNGEDDSLPVIQRDIPFREDGTLQFLDADSTVITTIAIEIADSDSAQARGLMERRSLPSQSGMLFPYDEPDILEFWMRNTPLSLDIIFADEHGRVVDIERATTPYSEETISPDTPSQYAVEVRRGFTNRYNLQPDSTFIRWNRHE